MSRSKVKLDVIIKSSKGGVIKPTPIKFNLHASQEKHIKVGTFVFEDKDANIFKSVEQHDEILATVTNLDSQKVIVKLDGFVEKMTNNFEKDPKTLIVTKSEVTIEARSFPSILTRNTIKGLYNFQNGYGEIVRDIASRYGFDTSNVKLINKVGEIYFKEMTILEAFRRMAYLQDWRVHFDDRLLFFEPVRPPEDSGIVLRDENILGGGYTKF
jgi:F0F1-type ATP synthase gamma subunit